MQVGLTVVNLDLNLLKRHESLQLLESPKVPRTEEPPAPELKVKAARTEVRMVYDVEAITTEEVGLEEMWDAYPMDFEVEKNRWLSWTVRQHLKKSRSCMT